MAKNDNWTCKDGTQIKMWKMTDNHLMNAIKYFAPFRESHVERWELLVNEKKRRDKANKPPDEPIESRFDILDL